MASRIIFLVCVVLALGTLVSAIDTSCGNSTVWSKRQDRKSTGVTKSKYSQCQLQSFNSKDVDLSDTKEIQIGGSGGAELFGQTLQSKDGGCGTNEKKCMQLCEALCCLTPTCTISQLHRKTKKKDYVVYVEKEKYYYCSLFLDRSGTDGDNGYQLCSIFDEFKTGRSRLAACAPTVLEQFGMNMTTYTSFYSMGFCDTNCTACAKANIPKTRDVMEDEPLPTLDLNTVLASEQSIRDKLRSANVVVTVNGQPVTFTPPSSATLGQEICGEEGTPAGTCQTVSLTCNDAGCTPVGLTVPCPSPTPCPVQNGGTSINLSFANFRI